MSDVDIDVSVLLVTYNSRAFIDRCIDSLRETVTHRYEVIVADNTSADGTAEHLRRTRPEVTVLDMGANRGFATANECAYRTSRGRHVLLLNGDAFVGEEAVDRLIDFLDTHPAAGAASPRLLNPDGTDQATARAFPTPAAALAGRRSPLTRWFPNNPYATRYLAGRHRPGDEPFEIDWASGACLMVPRRVIDDVGFLDTGFFMYWEDADWCRRIKDRGFQVWCVAGARATHAEGGSRRGWPPAQVRHFHRSAYRYYAKHHLKGARRALRPGAATALVVRAACVIALDHAHRRPSTSIEVRESA